jgi:tousled-like kinase
LSQCENGPNIKIFWYIRPIETVQKMDANLNEENGDKENSDSSKEEFSKETSTKDENSLQMDSSVSQSDNDKFFHFKFLNFSRKKRRRFQPEEDKKILEGVEKYTKGDKSVDWDSMTKWCELERTKDQIKYRYRLLKRQTEPPITSPSKRTSSSLPFLDSFAIPSESPERKKIKKNETEIEDHPLQETKFREISTQTEGPNIDQLEIEKERLKLELNEMKEKTKEKENKFKNILIKILKENIVFEKEKDKLELRQKTIKLGTLQYQRKGIEVFEFWQDGELFEQLEENCAENEMEREKFEKLKRQVQKQKSNVKKKEEDENMLRFLNEQEEIYKTKLNFLKHRESELKEEREKLNLEKFTLMRKIKLHNEEEKSSFKNSPLLSERYLLMKLLGKGGFSEVYKAYDLEENRIVACKIHQLSSTWKENRKSSYIKHVLRECQIHKNIDHPRVVKMYDTFLYDNNTYVTVLDYCDGNDLDFHLKTQKLIPEKEAKLIIGQVFSGLKYLNEQKQKIIHFDLKPANMFTF